MDDETAGRPPAEGGEAPPQDDQASGPDAAPGDTGDALHEAGADTAQTVVGNGGDAETMLTPSAGDEATRVMAGLPGDSTPTRVMGEGGGAPPPSRPEPTLMMARPPKEGSGTAWIVVLAIVLLLVAAAAAWYFLIRDTGTPAPTPTPTTSFAWVGAWSPTDGSGGGLVVQESNGAYQVTVYDPTVQVVGSATAAEDGKDLTFDLQTDQALSGVPGPYQVRLSPGSTGDLLSMSLTGSNGTTIIVPLERVAALVPVTPSASPSPTVAPTPTPTISPTGSPSPSPTAADQQVKTGIQRIQVGVITWATNNNNLYPDPAEVTEAGGIATYVDPWPVNPYTGDSMKPGTGPGEYTYEQLNGGAGYRLTGYIADGLTYTVP